MNEFNEGQWWFKEIECALSEGTPDQRRAIAVIRNLLQTVNENEDKERMDFIEELKQLADQIRERIKGNAFMEDGTPRWVRYGVTRRIICAANNYGGYIVTGARHFCPIMCMQIDSVGHDLLLEFAGGYDNVEQGFIDQYGLFMDREEAYQVAKAAGQILTRHEWGETLYSESIY